MDHDLAVLRIRHLLCVEVVRLLLREQVLLGGDLDGRVGQVGLDRDASELGCAFVRVLVLNT